MSDERQAAPPTVTITLSREDAEVTRNLIREALSHRPDRATDWKHSLARAYKGIEAALSAGRPPAPIVTISEEDRAWINDVGPLTSSQRFDEFARRVRIVLDDQALAATSGEPAQAKE